jgi:hypothetical protein
VVDPGEIRTVRNVGHRATLADALNRLRNRELTRKSNPAPVALRQARSEPELRRVDA